MDLILFILYVRKFDNFNIWWIEQFPRNTSYTLIAPNLPNLI